MADPPDMRTKTRTNMYEATAIQRNSTTAREELNYDEVVRMVRSISLGSATTALTLKSLGASTDAVCCENNITNAACEDVSAVGNTLTAHMSTRQETTANSSGADASDTTSPFCELPGELRNRIYRSYFEDFEEQMSRRFAYNKSRMTPTYLSIMHLNRKLRSEASSIFYKEVASFHCFPCPTDQPIEAVVLSRVRDVCALVSIRDVHMRISICCIPSWNEHLWAGSDREDKWRCGEIKAFANRTLIQISANATQSKIPFRALSSMPDTRSSCDTDRTTEARVATQFLIKYKVQGVREDENFIHIEGPLAEVDWRKRQGGWSF